MATFCPACRWWANPLHQDDQGRPRGCPSCQARERHRFLALLLPTLAGRSGLAHPAVLDVAPSPATNPLLDRLWPGGHLRMDFDPAADGRPVDLRASMTDIPLADGSVDLLLSSHVLEHIPDDRAAMRETARVLHPEGIGVLAVPIRAGETDEDPTVVTAEERVRRFGQADHVRYYGDDFPDRLAASGLAPMQVMPRDVLDPDVVRLLGLDPTEKFWLVQAEDSPAKLPTFEQLHEAATAEFMAGIEDSGARFRDLRITARRQEKDLDKLRSELRATRRALAGRQRQIDRIREHPVVAGALKARRAVRRLTTR